jgi:predicted transglutaminase-like cysteine proteinase
MKYPLIYDLDRQARRGFTYKPDVADEWRSHSKDVYEGKSWEGDCDDLASTVLDLLASHGAPLEDLYRLIVVTKTGVGHMIGAIKEEDGGRFWIVGDTFKDSPYPVSSMEHKPHEYNRLSEAGANTTWRMGLPWLVTR